MKLRKLQLQNFRGIKNLELDIEDLVVLLLEEGAEETWLTKVAAAELASLRDSYGGVLERGTAPLEMQPDGVHWHTFAGAAVNRLLSAGLEQSTGTRWIAGNLSLRSKDVAMAAASEAVYALASLDWEHIAAGAARGMARGTISKFQPCLPEEDEDRLLAERLLDLAGTLRFLGSVRVGGVRLAPRPGAGRLRDDGAGVPGPMIVRVPTRPEGVAAPKNPIEWVDTPAGLRAVAEVLAREEIVGLDVETALDFGTLCLIQIAIAKRTYLIDPFAVGDLAPLRSVLSASSTTKIIHNARFESRVLAGVGVELKNVFDTLTISRTLRGPEVLGGHSLAMVCERELGLALDKTEQTSSWSHRPLTIEQLRYAALDAEILLELHHAFAPQMLL